MSITITGGISFSGALSIVAPPTEATAGWYGGGKLDSGGGPYSTVARITYATDTATASVRGPLSLARATLAASGNTTYGWFGGGRTPPPVSTVDRITYATDTATASVRGPLSASIAYLAATGSTTDGWFAGGVSEAFVPNYISRVERITYATDTATASVRGPLSSTRYLQAATSDITTYGWFGGGRQSPNNNVSIVDRITYATDTATASVRGPLSSNRYILAATGNQDYGWFGGGQIYPGPPPYKQSTVDRITYATDTATASVRGPLSVGRYQLAASGNTTDGWFGGGVGNSGSVSTVDRITYATDTATASVRGPLGGLRDYLSATSGIQ